MLPVTGVDPAHRRIRQRVCGFALHDGVIPKPPDHCVDIFHHSDPDEGKISGWAFDRSDCASWFIRLDARGGALGAPGWIHIWVWIREMGAVERQKFRPAGEGIRTSLLGAKAVAAPARIADHPSPASRAGGFSGLGSGARQARPARIGQPDAGRIASARRSSDPAAAMVEDKSMLPGRLINYIGTDGLGPAMQMALDEVMLRSGVAAVRAYTWANPAVTFGYPLRWDQVAEVAELRVAIRRLTGGGIVEHGDDLTLTVVVPGRELPNARAFYGEIHRRFVGVLESTTPGVRLAAASDLACGCQCFTSPVADDVMLDTRKILGGAQRRTRQGLLYQGSLQLKEYPAGLALQLANSLATQVESLPVPEPMLEEARALAVERYECAAWNQR